MFIFLTKWDLANQLCYLKNRTCHFQNRRSFKNQPFFFQWTPLRDLAQFIDFQFLFHGRGDSQKMWILRKYWSWWLSLGVVANFQPSPLDASDIACWFAVRYPPSDEQGTPEFSSHASGWRAHKLFSGYAEQFSRTPELTKRCVSTRLRPYSFGGSLMQSMSCLRISYS